MCFLIDKIYDRLPISYEKCPKYSKDTDLVTFYFKVFIPSDLSELLSNSIVYYYYFRHLRHSQWEYFEEDQLVYNKQLRKLNPIFTNNQDELNFDGLVTTKVLPPGYLKLDFKRLKESVIGFHIADFLGSFFNKDILKNNQNLIRNLNKLFLSLCSTDVQYKAAFENVMIFIINFVSGC